MNTRIVWIIGANLLSLSGSVMLLLGALTRSRERLFLFQGAECFFLSLSQLMLGAISGAVVQLVGVIRNLVLMRGHTGRGLLWLFLSLTVGGGILVGLSEKLSLISLFPLVSTVIWTVGSFLSRSERSLRRYLSVNLGAWAIYSIFVLDFVGAITNAIGFIFTLRKIQNAKNKA